MTTRFFATLMVIAGPLAASAQPPNINDLSLQDIQQAAIGLVNIVTTPELESALFRVDSAHRETDLTRSTVGFSGEYLIRNRVFNGYWGAALSTGSQDQTVTLQGDQFARLQARIKRKVDSIQGSAGLVLPITEYFKLRPYLTGSYARLDSDSDILQFTCPWRM